MDKLTRKINRTGVLGRLEALAQSDIRLNMQRVQRQLNEQQARYSKLNDEVTSLDQLLASKTGEGQSFDPRMCLDIRRQIQDFEGQREQVSQVIRDYQSESDRLLNRLQATNARKQSLERLNEKLAQTQLGLRQSQQEKWHDDIALRKRSEADSHE